MKLTKNRGGQNEIRSKLYDCSSLSPQTYQNTNQTKTLLYSETTVKSLLTLTPTYSFFLKTNDIYQLLHPLLGEKRGNKCKIQI